MAEEKSMEQKIEHIKEHIYNFPIELEANNSIKIYSRNQFNITKIFINIKNIYTQFPESFKKYRSISGYLLIDEPDKSYKDIIDNPPFDITIQQIINNKTFIIKLIGVDIAEISHNVNQVKLKFYACVLLPSR